MSIKRLDSGEPQYFVNVNSEKLDWTISGSIDDVVAEVSRMVKTMLTNGPSVPITLTMIRPMNMIDLEVE